MTTATKTVIESKWAINKIQEESTLLLSKQWFAAFEVLSKYGPEAIKEFEQKMLQEKAEHYKKLGVKTPIELVKAMAEFEVNVFGSKIEVSGDDKEAWLTYQLCGCWNAMQKARPMTPEMEEKMGQCFQTHVGYLAEAFGFKGEVKFEEPCATIHFIKK